MLLVLLSVGGAYVLGGIALGGAGRGGGGPLQTRHPHYNQWREYWGLVEDGVGFCRQLGGGAGRRSPPGGYAKAGDGGRRVSVSGASGKSGGKGSSKKGSKKSGSRS